MLSPGKLDRKCFQRENSRSPSKILDGLFQVSAPFTRDPSHVGRPQDVQRLGVLKGKSLECAYIQCGVAAEDSLFQVVLPLPLNTQLVGLPKSLLSQGILIRENSESEDGQSGTQTGNG